jgi:hypothetical protein
METVAVYWEPIIRTYGFDVRTGLTLAQLELPTEGSDDLALLLEPGAPCPGGLVMAAAGRNADSSLALWVVLDGVVAQDLRERAQAVGDPTVIHPVEVVCFHGPHFGDRYGIASAALSVLQKDGITVLLASCTSASVFLAVECNEGRRTVQSLQIAFTAPGESGQHEKEESEPQP